MGHHRGTRTTDAARLGPHFEPVGAPMSNAIVPIKRALLSVFDKTGMADFAKALAGLGVELVSTGGTSKLIASTGAAVRDISDVTGIVDPADYDAVLEHIRASGGVPYELRQRLAAKAYARTAAYDSVISSW